MDQKIIDDIFFNDVLCTIENGFIFGGSIRDRMAGLNYNDVDIYVENPQIFISKFCKLGYDLLGYKTVPNKYGYNNERGYSTIHVNFVHKEFCTKHPVDFQLTNPFSSQTIDVDVNLMMMNRHQIKCGLKYYDLHKIMQHAKDRKYFVINDSIFSRKRKLSNCTRKEYLNSKGFSETEESSFIHPNKKSISL